MVYFICSLFSLLRTPLCGLSMNAPARPEERPCVAIYEHPRVAQSDCPCAAFFECPCVTLNERPCVALGMLRSFCFHSNG